MKTTKFTFADLFCGIGGMRLGFEGESFRCVFSSEIDAQACNVYNVNFGERPDGDIIRIPSSQIPDFDVLVGGFPCQPYSAIGLRKGFNDVRGGSLIRNMLRILSEKKPNALMLENVKGFATLEDGECLKSLLEQLSQNGYFTKHKILNSKDFGLPQNRERIFIVGFKNKEHADKFCFPAGCKEILNVDNVLEHDISPKYRVTENVYRHLKENHKRYKKVKNISGTLTASHSCLFRNLIEEKLNSETSGKALVRTFTPRECARLQGFPESFDIAVSDHHAYRLFGNSVSVPVIKAIADHIKKALSGETIEINESNFDSSKRGVISLTAFNNLEEDETKRNLISWHEQDKRNHWGTPDSVFTQLNEIFNFSLDTAASPECHKAKIYFTKGENGLTQSWQVNPGESVWCNPPYAPAQSLMKWCEKANSESVLGNTVALLLPAKCETKYFQYALRTASHVLFLKGRLRFLGPSTAGNASFGSALLIYNGYKLDLEPLRNIGSLAALDGESKMIAIEKVAA